MWVSEGPVVNPVQNTILADTAGMEASAARRVQVVIASTVALVVSVEVRNPANDANVQNQYVAVPANQTFQLCLEAVDMSETDQRVRLRVQQGGAGVVQGSILA
jgi:hypothetical protein